MPFPREQPRAWGKRGRGGGRTGGGGPPSAGWVGGGLITTLSRSSKTSLIFFVLSSKRKTVAAPFSSNQPTVSVCSSAPPRFLHAVAGRPDESTAECMDGDPDPSRRVPLTVLRRQGACGLFFWLICLLIVGAFPATNLCPSAVGVRRGLHHGRGPVEARRTAGPEQRHPAAGQEIQDDETGEGGIRHAQGHRVG